MRRSIPANFVPSHMVTEHSPQGICDICGHPYVGLAMDCACTGSPTKRLLKRPNWFMRFMRGVWQIIEGLLGMDPPRSR